MQDIRELDGRGIPGGYVASQVFATAARTQGEAVGFHPDAVFVPHPIQDRTDLEMRALADAAFDSVWKLVCACTAGRASRAPPQTMVPGVGVRGEGKTT